MSLFDREMVEEIDESLSEMGKLQAAGMAETVRRLGIERIVSSTRKRAVETARIISGHSGIPYRGRYNGLVEINFGKCRADRNILTRLLMSGRWPRPMRNLTAKGVVTTVSVFYFLQWFRGKTIGGESLAEIYHRISRMLKVLETFPESRIALVGHAGWIWCLALRIIGPGWNLWKLSRVHNCSLTRIDSYGEGKYELKYFALRPAAISVPVHAAETSMIRSEQ